MKNRELCEKIIENDDCMPFSELGIENCSDEELASRYIDGEHLFKVHFPVGKMSDLEEMIKDNVKRAFIAGRKSK